MRGENRQMRKLAEKQISQDTFKIAMLGHKSIPSRSGGVEIVVEELSTRLAEQGYEVVCYSRKGSPVSGNEFLSAKAEGSYKGVRVKPVFTINAKGLAAMTSSAVASLKAAFGSYDVVHFHAEGPCAMLWLPHLFGKRTVATIHGLDHKRCKWGKFASAYILLGEMMAAKFADEIIVLSENVQQYFKTTYGRETRLIPNGVDRPDVKKAEQITETFGLCKDEYILFLGRIVPEKGIRYLIEAFQNVDTKKKLVIAGGASDTDAFMREMKALAANDNRIFFTGFVEGQILEELYSNAYVYTLPSDLEGMPLSLLEAMSYHNCCLVSDIAECSEVVENHGIVFKKGDVADLTAKLQLLCDQPELVRTYQKDAANFICKKYVWDDVVAKTLFLYREEKTVAATEPNGEVKELAKLKTKVS